MEKSERFSREELIKVVKKKQEGITYKELVKEYNLTYYQIKNEINEVA